MPRKDAKSLKEGRKKNRFFEVHDAATGLIFEVWASSEKKALSFGRFREWARGPSHEGLRRILRVVAGENYPVLEEEANYFTFAREQAERTREAAPSVAELAQQAEHAAQQRAERAAAEEAAYAVKLVAMRADQADRRERRAALDARLGVKRPIFDLPAQDPATGEWI